MERYYSINEVAEMFGVTRKAVYDWMSEGRLEYVVVGARRRVKQSAIDTFIAAGTRAAVENSEKNEAPGLTPAYALTGA